MKEFTLTADGLTVRWRAARAAELPCRGVLSDRGVELVTARENRFDLEWAREKFGLLPVLTEEIAA